LGDDFCCFLEWDCFCRDRAVEVCGELTRPTNDTCGPAPQNRNAGAQLITIPFTAKIPTPAATAIDTLDPPACCHNGLPLGCDSGTKVNQTCVEDDDCIDAFSPDAKCLPRPPQPYFSLWYTCDSSSEDATDSLIQLFAVGDPNADTDEEACASLFPIACSDDAGTSGANGCSGDPLLSNMCAEGLIVGEPYYLMVATKSFDTVGEYRFTIGTTACTNAGSVPNDWCNRGTVVTDGPPKDPELVPFNMTGSTLNCPGPTCVESVDKDLWYDYTATCTGPATIGCHGGNPATNLIIYDGCECPGLNEEPLACTNEVPPLACGEVTFNVVAGKCYKIRLGNENANTPTGTLAIACDGTGCPPGAVSFFEPLNGTVDAGIPTAPDNAAELEGIQTIKVMAPVSLEAPEACFAIDCETEPFGGDPNAILDVVEEPGQPGTYTIALARPISPYAVTRIRYLGSAPGPTTRAPYTGHPCNVDGDFGVVADTDVGLLVDVLEGLAADPPFNVFVQWGDYGTDVDRSSDTTALDLVMLMDLFNGAGAFESCDNTLRPSAASCPP
jgi:hypothetical protein